MLSIPLSTMPITLNWGCNCGHFRPITHQQTLPSLKTPPCQPHNPPLLHRHHRHRHQPTRPTQQNQYLLHQLLSSLLLLPWHRLSMLVRQCMSTGPLLWLEEEERQESSLQETTWMLPRATTKWTDAGFTTSPQTLGVSKIWYVTTCARRSDAGYYYLLTMTFFELVCNRHPPADPCHFLGVWQHFLSLTLRYTCMEETPPRRSLQTAIPANSGPWTL